MNPTSLPYSKSLRYFLLALAALLSAAPLRADLNSDLAFSAFQNVDVNALASGTVLQQRGGLMTFQRGITSQALFIVNAAPADVAKKLATWSPSSHSELKVWLHKSLPAQPTLADFGDLANLPDNKSVNFQIDATAHLDPAKPALQVSKEEAASIAAAAQQEKNPRALYAKVWPPILLGRINTMLAGNGSSEEDLNDDGTTIHPLSDIKSLFHSDIKVYGQYQRLLNQTPFKALASAGSGGAKLAPTDIYYEMFDVEGSAALGTGAMFQGTNGNAIQSLDVEYFTNYGVYATVELEQMWPIQVGGKNETIVWRGDLVSAPNIASLHGVDRLGAGMIMLQDTMEGVKAFRDEFR